MSRVTEWKIFSLERFPQISVFCNSNSKIFLTATDKEKSTLLQIKSKEMQNILLESDVNITAA